MNEDMAAVEVVANEDDDLAAGYAGETPTETPEPEEAEQQVEEAATGEQEAAQPEEVPEYVQITKADYERLMGAVDTVVQVRSLQDKAFGKIGGIERFMHELQTQTPAGVEITEEDVKDLADEYPEIGAGMLKTLQKVATKFKGTGSNSSVNTEQFNQLLQQQVEVVREDSRRELGAFLLDDRHPDWRDVISTPDWEAWKQAQSPEFQQEIAISNDPRFVLSAMGQFKTHRAAQRAAQSPQRQQVQQPARQDRMQAAVTPKGVGGVVQPSHTDDDDFIAGYNSV